MNSQMFLNPLHRDRKSRCTAAGRKGDQLGILLTATLASIGAAAVPGAGMIMLVIVLGAAGIPEAGLALIMAVDRPLDMLRTVANVTSDASVSVLVANKLKKLNFESD